jgi:DNA modification methylase
MNNIIFQNLIGDCKECLSQIAATSIATAITSPPYADARKKQYNGPAPDEFVEWFLPIANEVKRVLKPDGTFIINIKERVVGGERHPYVMELIIALRKEGWLWTEEWIWHKKNCFPGKWPNRFRDAWERCLQFNLDKHFKMNQDAVMVPVGDWAEPRLKNLSETDKKRDPSKSGSTFGKNVSNWVGRDLVYPTNVLHLPTECGNKGHPAAFPKSLPTFFVKLFSDEGDTVLDPFEGGGTTGVAAVELGRNYIGIDLDPKYSAIAKNRITEILK